MAEELYFGQGGGGTAVGGSFTAGASTGGNTAGTTGTVSNGVLFFGGANITLSESSGAGGASLSIVGGAGAAFSGGVSSGGNSAGTTGTVGNGIRFFGGNNITLSQSSAAGGATISFVGPNTSAQQTGISGIAGSGASTVTNGTVQFGNANNMSFGLNGSTMTGSFSQSIQTQGSVQINGSTGAISFNAGNNMSLSTVASNLTFINVLSSSGIAQNVSNVSSAGTQSSRYALADHAHVGVAGVNASGTASTFVGNLMLSGANLTLVTGGNSSAGSIGFSVAAQTVESQTMGMSNLGNTSGTSGVASGGQVRMLFAGGNNITLSQSVNGASATITISGGAGGAFTGGVSTGGNTAGTTGTVNNGILFYGGANVTLSQSSAAGGATVSIVGGAGGAFSGGVSTQGNTSGTTGTVGNGIVFVGGNNITLSQSSAAGGATVTISAPSGGGVGVSSGGNTAGTTGTVDFQMVFVGSNNITLSQSINGSSGTISIVGGAGGGGAAIGITNTGNTAGTNFSSTSGTIWFQGTNNITVSNSSAAGIQTIWISGQTQSVQTQNSVQINGSSGAISFNAGNNMSLSTVASNLTFINVLSSSGIAQNVSNVSSAGTQSSRYALADHAHIGVAGLNASGTASTFVGNVMISVGNNLTMSTGGNSSAGTLEFFNLLSSSVIAQNVSNVSSAGTLSSRFALADHAHVGVAGINVSGTASTFVGNVMISVSNLTLVTGGNATAGSIGISAAAPGAGVALGMTNTGNTSGTTFSSSSGTMYFQGTNNVTVSNSSAAGAQTLWISGPSGGGAGMGTGANTSGTSGTVGDQLFFYGGANISLSQSVTSGSASLSIIGAAQTVESQSFGASNLGNTQGTSGMASGGQVRFAIVGSNNITLSQSINGASGTISIIGGAGGAFSGGVSTGGNTAGSTGTVGSQIVFVGTNGISLSQSTNGASATISISGGGGGGVAIGMTNTGNTSGTTFSSSSGTMYFQGTQNITVSNSSAAGAQTLWISGPTGGGAGMGSGTNTSGTSGTVGKELYIYANNQLGLSQSVNGSSASLTINGEPLRSKFYWMPDGQASSSQITMGSASFQAVMVPYDLSFSRIDIPLLIASTSSATTNTCALVISSGLVIYSVSNNSTLNPITGSFGTTTHTFASNTAGNQSIAGARYASFALGTSLSAGWYVVGFQLSTANTSSVGLSTTAIPFAVSILLGSVYTASGFADIGSASAATTDIPWGRGVANSTITATNATMNINGITQTGVSKFRGNFHVLFRNIS